MASTPLDVSFIRPSGERPVYTFGAIAALVVLFVGFAPTYFLKGFFGGPELSTLKHVHGVVMTAWFTLFLVQVRLVATGHTALHRKVGVFGALLAIVVLTVGVSAGIASARAGATPIPEITPLQFLVMPIGEMITFGTLFGAAIAMRKRSAYHKRLMLLASLAMLTPAFARIVTGGPLVFYGLTDGIILACIAYDTFRNRRVHAAFIGGLILIVVVQFGRLALSQTPQWTAFAKWLVG